MLSCKHRCAVTHTDSTPAEWPPTTSHYIPLSLLDFDSCQKLSKARIETVITEQWLKMYLETVPAKSQTESGRNRTPKRNFLEVGLS